MTERDGRDKNWRVIFVSAFVLKMMSGVWEAYGFCCGQNFLSGKLFLSIFDEES